MQRWCCSIALLAPALASAQSWSPIDEDGWPQGVSLRTLRALRPCEPGETMPGPGEVIPCRPPIHAGSPQVKAGVELVTGLATGAPVLTSGVGGLGVEAELALTRHLSLGGRYELLAFGERTRSDRLATMRSQRVMAQARARLFIDEVDREAVALAAGVGWGVQGMELGGDAPVARIALAREVGHFADDDNTFALALEVAATRSFGELEVDTLMISARAGFEANVRAPRNLGTEEAGASRFWSAGEAYLSPWMFGAGYSVGARLLRHVHAIGTVNNALTTYRDDALDGVFNTWGLEGGVRVIGGPGVYAQAQAGAVWLTGNDGGTVRTIGDAELGLRLGGCGGGTSFGLRLRADLDDGVDVVAGTFVARFESGGGSDAPGRCGRSETVAVMPLPPPDPPPPEPASPPPSPPPRRRVEVAERVEQRIERRVDVAVEVTPVEITVDLGAVLLGGLIEVRIDPRVLPLAQLRASGVVDVRIEGPAEALVRVEGELRAALARDHIAVRGVARVVTGGSRLRAVFTLGAR
ncbi:MAG TPA: hypothetical protein VM513_15315 [Kofleriaceae bacterium]|nr:hypothetical protein [Kofleriaceae bacterium]